MGHSQIALAQEAEGVSKTLTLLSTSYTYNKILARGDGVKEAQKNVICESPHLMLLTALCFGNRYD